MEIIGTTIALADVAVKLAMFGSAIKNAPEVWYEYSAALHNVADICGVINNMITDFSPNNAKGLTSHLQRELSDQLASCNKGYKKVVKDANKLLERFKKIESKPEKKGRRLKVGQWIFTMSRRFGFVIKEPVIKAYFETINHVKASMHLLVSLIGLASMRSGYQRIEQSVNLLSKQITKQYEAVCVSRRARRRSKRPIEGFFYDERRVKPMARNKHRSRPSFERRRERATTDSPSPRDYSNNAASKDDRTSGNDAPKTAHETGFDVCDPDGTHQALDLYPWNGRDESNQSPISVLLLEAPTEYDGESVTSSSGTSGSIASFDSISSNHSTYSPSVSSGLELQLLMKSQLLMKFDGSADSKQRPRHPGITRENVENFCVKSLSLQHDQYTFVLKPRCITPSCDHAMARDIERVLCHQQQRQTFATRITQVKARSSDSRGAFCALLAENCPGKCSHTQLIHTQLMGFDVADCTLALHDFDFIVESAPNFEEDVDANEIWPRRRRRIPSVMCLYCSQKPHPAAFSHTKPPPIFSSGTILVYHCGQCRGEIWLWQ